MKYQYLAEVGYFLSLSQRSLSGLRGRRRIQPDRAYNTVVVV